MSQGRNEIPACSYRRMLDLFSILHAPAQFLVSYGPAPVTDCSLQSDCHHYVVDILALSGMKVYTSCIETRGPDNFSSSEVRGERSSPGQILRAGVNAEQHMSPSSTPQNNFSLQPPAARHFQLTRHHKLIRCGSAAGQNRPFPYSY